MSVVVNDSSSLVIALRAACPSNSRTWTHIASTRTVIRYAFPFLRTFFRNTRPSSVTTVNVVEILLVSQLREAGKCIHNYTSECLEAMPKQVTSLLLKGSNSELAKQCDGEDKRTGKSSSR